MRLNRHFLLLLGLGLSSICAAEVTSIETSTHTEATKTLKHRIRLTAPIPTQAPEQPPEGFTEAHLGAPFQTSYQLQVPLDTGNTHFILDANIALGRSGIAPMYGISPGLSYRISQTVLTAQVDLQNQTSLNQAPYKNSPFSLVYWGPGIGVSQELGKFVRLGLTGQMLITQPTQLGAFEGVVTTIDHKSTLAITPTVTLTPFRSFELEGGVGIYQLGTTAIASRDFAWSIQSKTLYKWNIGAAYTLGDIQIRGTHSIVTGSQDPVELNYQSPFLAKHYLLAKQTFTMELIWSF